MAPGAGFEPTTISLTGSRTAVVLPRNVVPTVDLVHTHDLTECLSLVVVGTDVRLTRPFGHVNPIVRKSSFDEITGENRTLKLTKSQPGHAPLGFVHNTRTSDRTGLRGL